MQSDSKRQALVRAIGAWANARERYARDPGPTDKAKDANRREVSVLHVAMLQAIDDLEAAE